jgi:hypothetical protein
MSWHLAQAKKSLPTSNLLQNATKTTVCMVINDEPFVAIAFAVMMWV